MCVRYYADLGLWIRWIRDKGIWVEIPPPKERPVQHELFPGRRGHFIRATPKGFRLEAGRFGLVPGWSEPLKGQWSKGFYNARAEGSESRGEGIENMPAFSEAFMHRRAVVPMESYFENADVGEAARQKRYVQVFPVDKPALLVAAIWNPPNRHCDEPSFSLVTTASRGALAEVHSRRLALLDEESLEIWRDPGAPVDALKEILWPHGPEPIRIGEAERPRREPVAKAAKEPEPSLFD